MRYRTPGYGWALLLTACLAGCGPRDKSAAVEQDSTAAVPEDVRRWLRLPGLRDWDSSMHRLAPGFREEAFVLDRADSLDLQVSGVMSPGLWAQYRSFMVFSPDSSLAVDLFSYGTIPSVDERGRVTLEGADPDSEVGLVDSRSLRRRRLLFAGPGTRFQDAGWQGDSLVIITGISDANADNVPVPMIWRLNLAAGTLQVLQYRAEDSAALPQP